MFRWIRSLFPDPLPGGIVEVVGQPGEPVRRFRTVGRTHPELPKPGEWHPLKEGMRAAVVTSRPVSDAVLSEWEHEVRYRPCCRHCQHWT